MPCKILFLDFDGVIADTMAAKSEAFAAAFGDHGAPPDQVIEVYRRHAGSGREVIFDRVYSELTGRSLRTRARARMAAAYGRRLKLINPALGLFPGVKALLERQARARLLAVVTGVPRDEIRGATERLGIAGFFADHFSATLQAPKDVLMAGFLAARGMAAPEALFVGDSIADMEAAERVPVPFVGVGEPAFFVAGAPRAVIPALTDIESHLRI
jgi:phosphoglycolate phosphatase-like HAD superfamily hydrolase